jgi:hypothetical protein
VVRLFHFSEDPDIAVFRPRESPSAPDSIVWAIDEDHSPSYWFPRDCPRACCWIGERPLTDAGSTLLGLGGARRLHALEASWLERVRACRLYAYELDAAPFRPKLEEAGYWVTEHTVTPVSITSLGDLLQRQVEAGIEVRIVPNLWPLIDAIVASGLEFSIIRKSNAHPRA